MLSAFIFSTAALPAVVACGAVFGYRIVLVDSFCRAHVSAAFALTLGACFATLFFVQLAQQLTSVAAGVIPLIVPLSEVGGITVVDVLWMALLLVVARSVTVVLRHFVDTVRLLKFARRRRLLQLQRR